MKKLKVIVIMALVVNCWSCALTSHEITAKQSLVENCWTLLEREVETDDSGLKLSVYEDLARTGDRRAIPLMLKNIDCPADYYDYEPPLCTYMLNSIADLGDSYAVPFLWEAYYSEHSERVKRYILVSLIKLGDQKATDLLSNELRKNPWDDAYLYTFLAKENVSEMQSTLLTILEMKCLDRSSWETADCQRNEGALENLIEAIAFMEEEKAMSFLRKHLENPSIWVRNAAAWATTRIEPFKARESLHKLEPNTIDDYILEWLWIELARNGDGQAIQVLKENMTESSYSFKYAGVLAARGDEEALEYVRRNLLRNGDAVKALREVNAELALKVWGEVFEDGLLILDSESPNETVRQFYNLPENDDRIEGVLSFIADQISKYGNEEHAGLLERYLVIARQSLNKTTAARVLGKIGTEESINLLAEYLDHEDPAVRIAAAASIIRLSKKYGLAE